MRLGRVAVVLGFVVLGAAAVGLRLPLCPSALFLGIPCPGCGLTRASLLLLSGDFAGALRMHPLSPLLAPLCALLIAFATFGYLRGPLRGRLPSLIPTRFSNPIAWALFALLLGVWGARFFGAFGGPAPVTSLTIAPFHGALASIPEVPESAKR
jgi:hypothetical protein